jgi:8-oxo-dGTP diphosphatase
MYDMEIKSSLTHEGEVIPFVYRDIDSLDELQEEKVKSIHAYCFCGDKLVIVYEEKKGKWGPPGGAVELGETVEEAVEREVLEESNMRVLKQTVFGYLETFEPMRTLQTRSVCIVEPIGPFLGDPDGDVTEIKLIDPKDINQYFDWGENGERQLERALILKEKI